MGRASERPVLHARAIQQALEAMRTGQLLQDHVLHSFVSVQLRLQEPHRLGGPVALQIAVFEFLTGLILGTLNEIRTIERLSPPDPTCTRFDIAADFSQGNEELEAWSALYARYICINRALSMGDLAAFTYQPERTLRRRLQHGVERLTEAVTLEEQRVRQQQKHIRLRLVLPHSAPQTLIGRDSELTTAVHVLQTSAPPHLLLHGPPGIGKTELALHIAHRLIDAQMVDAVVWVNLADEPIRPAHLLYELATRLALPRNEEDELAAMLRAFLATHATLIVLDRAEALTSTLEDMLTILDQSRVIVVSRSELPGAVWCTWLPLPELNEGQAYAFLEERVAHTEREAHLLNDHFADIWSVVGGNPLALKLALAARRHQPAIQFSALDDLADLYAALWHGLPSLEQQVGLAARLFYPVGISVGECHTLLPEYSRDDIAGALGQLSRLSLLDHRADGYFMPSLLAAFIAERGDHFALGDLIKRHVAHLQAAPDAPAALRMLQFARQIMFAPADWWVLAMALAEQITQASLWRGWLTELHALPGDELTPDQQLQWHLWQGVAARRLGELLVAAQSFEVVTASSPPHSEMQGQGLVELAVIRRYQGDWTTAHRLVQTAYEIFLRHESPPDIERCVHELAQIALDTQAAERALTWLSRLEEWSARAWIIASQAYLAQDQVPAALHAAHQALHMLPVHHRDRGRALVAVASVYAIQHQLGQAVDYLTSALDILNHQNDVLGHARTSNNLVAVVLEQPIPERSFASNELEILLNEALYAQEHAGDELGAAFTRHNLAQLLSGDA